MSKGVTTIMLVAFVVHKRKFGVRFYNKPGSQHDNGYKNTRGNGRTFANNMRHIILFSNHCRIKGHIMDKCYKLLDIQLVTRT